MSDNVGLSTPRGSGTSGYVQRNLAHVRPRESAAPYPRDLDALRQHRPRQPDRGILEHDRKREVEVKVFELRDRLEDDGLDEEEIDTRCDALRKKLLADMNKPNRQGGPGGAGAPPRKAFKMHQVHEQAEAKARESERLRRALKISKDYEEGSHWKRQEERMKKALEREAEAGAGAGNSATAAAPAAAAAGAGREKRRRRGEERDEEEDDDRSRSRSRSGSREEDEDDR